MKEYILYAILILLVIVTAFINGFYIGRYGYNNTPISTQGEK